MGVADRLFGDIVASPIADATHFLSPSSTITMGELTGYARTRGNVYASDLSATAASVQHGLEEAIKTWARMASPHGTVERGSHRDDAPLRIIRVLRDTASALLQSDGTNIVLRVDRAEPGREIVRWRFVSLGMPAGVLLAAASPLVAGGAGTLRLLHRSMAPDSPVAHQHLHHAAMLSFEDVWASLRMRALLEPSQFRRSLLERRALCPRMHPGACARGRSKAERAWALKHPEESAKHMAQWGDLLFSAFIARGLLDRHVGHSTPLEKCEHPDCEAGRDVLSRYFLKGRVRPYSFAGSVYPWPNDRFRFARLYRQAHSDGIFRRSQKERRAFMHDQAAEEQAILACAFGHVSPGAIESTDVLYELVLLQYLRIKTALYRLLVHPPGERGLVKFLDHFSQIKIYEPRSDQLRPSKPDEPGLEVAATEYRLAPDAWQRELGRGERDHCGRPRSIEEVLPGETTGEAAWLVHFKRREHRGQLPLYGRSIREMEGEARRIGNALEQDPRRLLKLRGIDICGVEEHQPMWVCAETLRKLRTRSSVIAGRRPGLKLQPLRLTLHAGEDFRWLTSGMRAVAEPFHWQLIKRGDRIGHGIAVTLEPGNWWQRHAGEVIESKRIDRLLDLGFLAAYTDGPHGEAHPLGVGRRTDGEERWLSGEIAALVDALGFSKQRLDRKVIDLVSEAVGFWTHIGGCAGRRLIERSTAPDERAPLHEHWLHRYFWRDTLQQRAEETIHLTVDDLTRQECSLLIKARKRLIRELARWQIPIESNPSSNLVVGSLDAMASQDFLAQSVEQAREAGSETLPWTISTDDPITFATSLADEYAYAWAGMVLREKNPYDPAHARALLDQAAATSMRTRFTVPNDER